MAATYRTQDGDMLDDLCWRHYGRQSGAVEVVLEANRGLAELGPIYTTGTLIALPDLAPPAASAGPVRLWD